MCIRDRRGKAERLTVTYNGAVTANFQGKRYPAATGSEWAKMMLSAAHEDINGSVWSIMDFTEDEFKRVANNEAFDWTTKSGIKYRIDPLLSLIHIFSHPSDFKCISTGR